MKLRKVCTVLAALPLLLGITAASSAHASVIPGSTLSPLIVAGAPPDSPGNRVDANTPASAFSGVVSINIRYDGQSFICSGTLVSKRDVVTAGHCIDTNGNGKIIDLNKPGSDVRVVFNSQPNPGDPGRAIITATSVSMNPNYQGFGNCPYATTTDFCLNDDIAVVTMGQDAPDTAKIFKAWDPSMGVDTGQLITMVGYGRSGDGIAGYTTGPDFRIKRSGQNVMDLFDLDDEQHFASGPQEVWYADFDGNGQDTFCTLLGVCTQILANDKEANIGGGDSGGPSFIFYDNDYYLVGNNTFGGTFSGQTPGSFGTYFGGMVVGAYMDYLESATNGRIDVPEPSTGALLLTALGIFGFAARRRKLEATAA
ncbi:MAG: trypsin-like serine protease [Betaproteobacteria bacterium]